MDIKIENLGKMYGLQKAVDGITFEVHTGEILGFLGPNGAGKTTTMKMITRYLEPDSGSIHIGGKSVFELDMKRHIGYLPEHNPLYDDMPVIDYLAYCAALQQVPKTEIPFRIREMVKVCGLNEEKHKKISELSKGYRQRVGLAQAMIHNPEILILDEPTTGLDVTVQAQILDLLRDLVVRFQMATMIITHDLGVVAHFCDDMVVMFAGNVVEAGPVRDVFANPAHPYTRSLIAATPERLRIGTGMVLGGQPPNLYDLPAGCALQGRCPLARPVCATPVPNRRVGDSHVALCHLAGSEATTATGAA